MRNVVVSGSRFNELLDALTSGETGRPELPRADFSGATFVDDTDFDRCVFTGDAKFSEATFLGKLRFRQASFRGDARFRGATFEGIVGFSGSEFENAAYFAGATFEDEAHFNRAEMRGSASFAHASFASQTSFADTTFASNADFSRARFSGPTAFSRASFTAGAEFGWADFFDVVDCHRASFEGRAFFERATFSTTARFGKSYFAGDARFGDAMFQAAASFANTSFEGLAAFSRVQFRGPANFNGASFSRSATFGMATFAASARYGSARFEREARFDGVKFEAGARFARASFNGDTRFSGTRCDGDARFQHANFRRARELGPLTVHGRLDLDDAVFHDHIRIVADAELLSARGATFSAGTHLRVRSADIALDDADFVRPSTLLGQGYDRQESGAAIRRVRPIGVRPYVEQPRLITVRGAHVAPLVLSEIDLTACRFFGAHGLESMRVEASYRWPSVPNQWWLSRRETVAEEHQWRRAARRRAWALPFRRKRRKNRPSAWYGSSMHPPERLRERVGKRPLASGQVAAVYRALRKAREDDKDEAGAGDLYYGEMEMRRHAKRGYPKSEAGAPARGERAILTAYWLVSGYGLRASRALAALTLSLLLGAALLSWFGFHDPGARDYGRALLFAVESSVSLMRPPETSLSAGGQVVQIALRLLGPLFFGLALLAVRARVKR